MIADCTIEECVAGGFGTAASGGRGAAIGLIGNSNATITNCTLCDNSGYYGSYGAGLYFQQSTATVVGCTIANNTAFSLRGGGADRGGTATNVTFRNCIFSENRADAGAGIYTDWVLDTSVAPAVRTQRGRVTVTNCTIVDNDLSVAAASGAAGGIQSSGAEVYITSSILWDNDGKALAIVDSTLTNNVTYSDIQGGWTGTGNLNTDPLFADEDQGDYHLKIEVRPLRSAGPAMGGRQRPQSVHRHRRSLGLRRRRAPPNGDRINMGADGGTKQASHSPEHFIYHVDGASGNDWKTGLSHEQAFATVQHAIDAAKDGDTVLVWPGTLPRATPVHGQGHHPAAVPPTRRSSPRLTTPSRSTTPRVPGASWRTSSSAAAPGRRLLQGASPTLRNLTIVGNGCGIVAYEGSDPNITNCILWSNRDTDLYGCKARFSDVEDGPDPKAYNIQRDPMFADCARRRLPSEVPCRSLRGATRHVGD